MSKELRECPFCGSDKIKIIKDGAGWKSGIECKCMNVYFFKKGINVNHCDCKSPQPIIDAWNTRHEDWVDIKEPPIEDGYYVVCIGGEDWKEGYYDNSLGFRDKGVTQWKPITLPEGE